MTPKQILAAGAALLLASIGVGVWAAGNYHGICIAVHN